MKHTLRLRFWLETGIAIVTSVCSYSLWFEETGLRPSSALIPIATMGPSSGWLLQPYWLWL